jgi:hypothetical protein
VRRPRLRLRCYCCGELITDRMVLVGFGDQVSDRVMVMRGECLPRADPENAAVFVCITAAQPGVEIKVDAGVSFDIITPTTTGSPPP